MVSVSTVDGEGEGHLPRNTGYEKRRSGAYLNLMTENQRTVDDDA